MKSGWLGFGKRVIGVLEFLRGRLQPLFDRMLPEFKERQRDRSDRDFVRDADYFIIQQEPLRARVLGKSIGVVLSVAVLWAAVAQVDEITRGDGKVIPSQQLQVLQSLDGGIVSEINVREGQVVDRDQILLRVDSTRFVSSVRESRAQYLALLARSARLRALAEGKPFVPPAEVVKESPAVVNDERRLFETATSELDAQVSMARQQLAQRQQELREATAKRNQAAQAYELTSKELAVTRPLIAVGAVSEVELLRLERDVGRFQGERDVATTQIARSQAAISEANGRIQEVELKLRNDARKELSETLAKLSAISEGSVGLADRVKQADIRSPVKGTIKRLLVNTVGGVVQPGKDLIEVVPLEDSLVLEAKVQPKDIAFLRPQQKALVKFTAYDFSIYGGLEARLENIGADSVTDERGNTFFVVRLRTLKSSLGKDLPVIPGMVAEVDIVTGQKSILGYLLKPVLRAKQVSFSER